MNFARPVNPRSRPPGRPVDPTKPVEAPLEHPMPDRNGTLIALTFLAITALFANGELGSTIARITSFGVLASLVASAAMDIRLGGLRNLIRADLMALVAFYFLTLFEFLYPQPFFDTLANAKMTHPAVLCVMLGFAGIFAGRHLLHPKTQPFEHTLNREIPPGWTVFIFWSCMVIGYAHMIIACDFNFFDMLYCFMEPRFSQPWTRGRLGDWKALLVELGLFIYLIPPLAGIMIARRRRYGKIALTMTLLGLALTFFYGVTNGTRSLFAAYLITFLIGYAFALPFADRKELVVLCIGSGVLMIFVSSLMLKFRDMGLRAYLNETPDPNAVSDNTYFVDYNIYNICRLCEVFPDKKDYLGWEIPYLALVRPIPRAIWAGKPEGMSTTIEDIVGAEGWTVSATFAGEAYMSGGFMAVGLIAICFGALTGWWSHLASSKNSELGILIYSSGFFATVISMRSLFVFTTALLPTVAALVMGTYAVRLLTTHAQRLLEIAHIRRRADARLGRPPASLPTDRPDQAAGAMKVAFVTVVPSPYQKDILRALSQRPELELSVFYLEASVPESPWPQQPLAPYERILRGFWFHLGTGRCHVNWPLPDLSKYDIVVMNTLMSITAQWLIRTALRKKPWIFWGERLGLRGGLHEKCAATLHRAAGIAAIGSFAEEDYRARFPEPRSFRIPYHCDLEPFMAAPRRARTDGNVVFLFCGQMIARKGLDLLFTAFQRLGGAARLLLVGPEAQLSEFLAPLPPEVRNRIEYAGFQAPEDLPRFFSRADVFILPSRYDGWGVVVNQALGAGLPIICSDMVGAGRDLVEKDINGLIFPAGIAAALSDCMQRFIHQPSLIDSWGKVSRRRAQHWTPEAGAAKWVEAFHTILDR